MTPRRRGNLPMLLFESSVPTDRRQTVAGLVKSAAVSCGNRRRFYTWAATHGLRSACAHLSTRTGTNREMLRLLGEELDEIESELFTRQS